MRKLIPLLFILSLPVISCMAQESYGYQAIYYCNQNQYDQVGFYVNGGSMIFMGTYYNCCSTPYGNVVMTTDTNGTFLNSYIISDPSYIYANRVKKIDANNSVFTGIDYSFPNCPFIGTFNHTTGAPGTGYYYNHSSLGFGEGGGGGQDAISLANSDLAMTGYMQENTGSVPGPTNLGICSSASNGFGFFDFYFGSSNYGKGNDIFLIRTGADGDTNNYTKGNMHSDGFIKKYGLAYCGPGYNPAQPTAVGHGSGNFCYQYFSSWIADSTRDDVGTSLIEVGGNIFITGYTRDYNSKYSGTNDYEGFLLKVNAAGSVQWCRTFYLNNAASAYELGAGLAAVTYDGSNDVIVTMSSYQSNNVELVRVANATGNIVWANSYNYAGTQSRPWTIKQTGINTFIIGVMLSSGPLGLSDVALLEVNGNGTIARNEGYGTPNADGSDSWNYIGPDVDVVNSKGTVALSCNTNFSGGTANGAFITKINSLGNNSGCVATRFTPTVTVTNRNLGDGNQLKSRIPLIYETRGGGTQVALTLTSTPITPQTITSSEICVLPIELLSFTATPSGKFVKTNWSTASETNNNYFTVERSLDAQTFEEVGRVKGAGNSSVTLDYAFTDEKPNTGISYYRLKQTDFDGKFTYSPIVPVNFAGNDEVNAFYNHETNNCLVGFNFTKTGNYKLKIINSLGQEVVSDDLLAIGAGPFEKTYSLNSFGKDMYIVYLISSDNMYVKKINAY
jgi:hypothetical protein